MMWESILRAVSELFGGGGADAGTTGADVGSTAAGGSSYIPVESYGDVGAATAGAGPVAGTAVASSPGWGDVLSGAAQKAAQWVVPQLVAGGVTAAGNKLFGQQPRISTRDIRTPEQMARERMGTNAYSQLTQDYTAGQAALPLWNRDFEDEIRRMALSEAARAGMQDSGQAMGAVNKAVAGERLKFAQAHETNQVARAGQLAGTPYQSMAPTQTPGYYPMQMAAVQPPVGPRPQSKNPYAR